MSISLETPSLDTLRNWIASTELPEGASCEVISRVSKERGVGWSDGSPHLQTLSSSLGFGVRVLYQGGQGLVKSTHLSPDQYQATVDRALAIAKNTATDPHRIAGTASPSVASFPIDAALFTRAIPDILSEFQSMENEMQQRFQKIKKMVRLHLSEEIEQKTIANNHGLGLETQSSSTGFLVEVLAEENGESQVAWAGHSLRFGRDLSMRAMVEDVCISAQRMLGAAPIASSAYTVVLEPRVTIQLMGLMQEALSAESVQMQRSFLAGKIDSRVFSDRMTFVDDPLLADGLNSTPVDDEGVACATRAIIENGILNSYFFDLRCAGRAGATSTGHGFRSGLASQPGPRSSNFYLQPGIAEPRELETCAPVVFVIHDVMGLHMADPVTGEFSLGASGFLYKKGQFVQAVRGVTMAGSLERFFSNVTLVGNDLTWFGSAGAPSVVVEDVAIAGS